MMLHDLDPATVAKGLADHSIVLIDVREAGEYAAERIHGALLFPLSTFDPAALPDAGGKRLVFSCGSGKRSAMAAQRAQAAGVGIDAHLAGGIMAWKQAGLPTVTIDPASGGVRDPA